MPPKPLPPTGEIVLYPTEDGRARVECRFAGDTVWLTQALMAELYGKDVRTINEHLQNLFEDQEIDPAATIRRFRIVRLRQAWTGRKECGGHCQVDGGWLMVDGSPRLKLESSNLKRLPSSCLGVFV